MIEINIKKGEKEKIFCLKRALEIFMASVNSFKHKKNSIQRGNKIIFFFFHVEDVPTIIFIEITNFPLPSFSRIFLLNFIFFIISQNFKRR